jgi:hypothetical protein
MNIRFAVRSPAMTAVLMLVGFLLSTSDVHGGQVVFSPPGPPRDRLPPPRIGSSTLKGRVIDGVTGSPIARARVRIAAGGPRPSVGRVLVCYTRTGIPDAAARLPVLLPIND